MALALAGLILPGLVAAEAQDPRLVVIVDLLHRGQPLEAVARADAMIAGFASEPAEPGVALFCNRDRGGVQNLVAALQGGVKADLAPEAWCEALFAKGYGLVALRRYAEAEQALAQAVAMDPSNAFFLNELALTQALQGRAAKARFSYGRAHALAAAQADDPAMRAIDARALRGMGQAARAQGDLAAAQEFYAGALAIEADDTQARAALAEIVRERAGK